MKIVLFGVAWLLVSSLAVVRAEESASPVESGDAARVAAKIDQLLERAWEAQHVTPAPVADDAEFLRRVSLDVGGKIPTVSEVREFLADPSPRKRRAVVERLLASPSCVTHFTNVWRSVLLPEADSDLQARFLVPKFDAWLREKLADNVSYDAMVREILTLPLDQRGQRNMNPYEVIAGTPTPIAFYQAKQIAPENLAAATSRMFLGLRIECAQCHNHPWDSWKREQFWSFAAFFAGIERRNPEQGIFGGVIELQDRREIGIPDTAHVVQAAYLDGGEPQWRFRDGPRRTLADWVVSRDNPYFARAAANRLWAQFFGRGIVDPVDDFSANNPPSHPELLDLLASEFAAHRFDLRFLVRALTASRAYQRTSARTHDSQSEPRSFARMAVKGMRPEQLYDSLAVAIGRFEPFMAEQAFSFRTGDERTELLSLFANSRDSQTETTTTILQALALMNGQLTAQATNVSSSRTLSAVIDFPQWSDADRIEALFLATVSRPPSRHQRQRLLEYVAQGGPEKNGRAALADVFWTLLNSSEFLFNH